MRGYIAISSNARTSEHHIELPYLGFRTDIRSLNISQRVNESRII